MNRDAAMSNLVAARDALTSVGATPFLVDGTLLGAVREGDFIAHDKDVDLGVFVEQYTARIPAAMRGKRFRLHKTYGDRARGLELVFKRRRIRLDVFFYYKDDAGRYHAAWKDGQPIRYGYWDFGLAPLEFRGSTFLAPDDPERYLATKYGPGWRTPVVDWDWAWGPANAEGWATA